MSQLLLDITPPRPPTLGNFETGENGELLAVLARLVAGERPGSLHLWGPQGSGKTHLLQACAASLPGAHYACGGLPEFGPVLLVDDVDALAAEEQVVLFDWYNRLRAGGGLLLTSAANAPAHLDMLGDLRTRLGWGLVYQLHPLSDADKAAALQRHAQERGFELPEEVTTYLLRHGRRDLPSLMAVLDLLDEASLRMQRSPSVPMLRTLLQSQLELN